MTPSSQRKEPPVIPDRFKDLDALTLLDALASCGKDLVEDPNGEASDAYLQILASWD